MPPRQNTSACKLGIFTSALLGRIHPALTQDLVSAGKSVAQAAKHLGIGRSTDYKMIRNTTP
jgi:transcriptional regulator of acetoin/glycerol metabolism